MYKTASSTSVASKAAPLTPAEDLTLVFRSALGSSLGPTHSLHSQQGGFKT